MAGSSSPPESGAGGDSHSGLAENMPPGARPRSRFSTYGAGWRSGARRSRSPAALRRRVGGTWADENRASALPRRHVIVRPTEDGNRVLSQGFRDCAYVSEPVRAQFAALLRPEPLSHPFHEVVRGSVARELVGATSARGQ